MVPDLSSTIKKWVELTLHKSIGGIFKFSKENNLSLPQLGVLMRLHHNGNCNVSVIGTKMGISSAAASQLMERMVQLGFIERTVDSNDRRIKNLNLTQKGQKILNESFRASQKWFEDLEYTLKNDEKKETITVLNRLINYANVHDDKPNLDK